MSHLACAEDKNNNINKLQLKNLMKQIYYYQILQKKNQI